MHSSTGLVNRNAHARQHACISFPKPGVSRHLIKRISSAECPRLPVPTTTSTNKPKKDVQHDDMRIQSICGCLRQSVNS